MLDEAIHKFATKMSVPLSSTIKLIVGGRVFKTIQTSHVTAMSMRNNNQLCPWHWYDKTYLMRHMLIIHCDTGTLIISFMSWT